MTSALAQQTLAITLYPRENLANCYAAGTFSIQPGAQEIVNAAAQASCNNGMERMPFRRTALRQS